MFFFEPPLQDISDGGSIPPESRLESNSANDSVFPLTKTGVAHVSARKTF